MYSAGLGSAVQLWVQQFYLCMYVCIPTWLSFSRLICLLSYLIKTSIREFKFIFYCPCVDYFISFIHDKMTSNMKNNICRKKIIDNLHVTFFCIYVFLHIGIIILNLPYIIILSEYGCHMLSLRLLIFHQFYSLIKINI